MTKTCRRDHVRPASQRYCRECQAIATRAREERMRDDPTVKINRAVLSADERVEWEHFAGFGWPDTKIARRLGLALETLRARERRLARRMAS